VHTVNYAELPIGKQTRLTETNYCEDNSDYQKSNMAKKNSDVSKKTPTTASKKRLKTAKPAVPVAMLRKFVPLTAADAQWVCPTKWVKFKTTRELIPLNKIVGQDRAIEAIRLGAQIRSQGYNIWASGVVGTGRMTTVRQILDEHKHLVEELYDFAYVYNFKQPECPVLLRFDVGEGRVFKEMMSDCFTVIKRRIPMLFDEEQFQSKRKEIIQRYQTLEQDLLQEYDAKLRPVGFVLGQLQEEDGTTRSEIFPLVDGKPLSPDELDELLAKGGITLKEVEKIRKKYAIHRDELNDLGRRSLRLMTNFKRELSKHDRVAVEILLNAVLSDVRHSFPRERVEQYLLGVTAFLLRHLEEYVKAYSAQQAGVVDPVADEQIKVLERKHYVNLIVDNYDTKTAPILVETSPTFASLFGTIEKRMDSSGFVVSDFTNIRAGSLLRADGGYIVLNAMDLLADATLWNALKKVLLYNRLEIQSPENQMQLNQINPEWIKVNVKVILLGDPSIYDALWAADEDFHKMFKVHSQFDDTAKLSVTMVQNYCRFFHRLAQEESLLHCNASGASAIVEWAVAYSESKSKISLQFSYVADVFREASHFAKINGGKIVTRTHVLHALEQRRWRSNSVDIQMREEITKGTLLIDVKGERVGQINGLTVYEAGIVAYGKPSRITATVSAGNAGIVNIEREVDMSGAIHSKGVLILSGLLRSLFSRSQPISFTASIAFEQSYGGIDGDSASVAEILILLSAISNIPIRQDFAITGSINQKGDVQPIGGVNEKITGFFEVCMDRGLTGTQGVAIPYQNVSDIMLRDEIVEAIRKKKFFIYPITTLEDAVEIMMRYPAGEIGTDSTFPEDTVYGKVQHNLDVLHEASRNAK